MPGQDMASITRQVMNFMALPGMFSASAMTGHRQRAKQVCEQLSDFRRAS
jgi:hypothetical protein